MRPTVLVLLALLSLACSDATGPTGNVQGTWVANYRLPGVSLVLTLAQTDGQVSGTGTYAIEAGSAGSVQVTGTYARPTIALSIHYEFGLNRTFKGTVIDAAHMTGVMSDSLGNGSPLSFTRN